MRTRWLACFVVIAVAALLMACGDNGGKPVSGQVGGTIAGLTTSGLALVNGTDSVSPAANAGSFTFKTIVPQGATYAVTVQTQPSYLICSVTNASGTMGTSAVTNVSVDCKGSTVSTLAGNTAAGSANGTGSAANFNNPTGVAVDGAGNVYVADSKNNLIRAITSAGVVTSFAGSGAIGAINGTSEVASFNNPSAVAVSNAGNVYVADSKNNLIRMITPAGVVTSLAGNGLAGLANGAGTAASFNNPLGIAVDGSGNVYVADTGSNLIRLITPAGTVTTLAGSGAAGSANGVGTTASFNNPTGIAVDSAGNVYVADKGNNLIRMITSIGVVSTLAGNAGAGFVNGTGLAASFNNPTGVAVTSLGNVYVADSLNNRIRVVTPDLMVNTLAGTGTKGVANGATSSASFGAPSGIALSSAGNVYVADTGNNMIRLITSQ